MTPLEKQVTSVELSKGLKELGVKQDSIYYWVQGGVYPDDWSESTLEPEKQIKEHDNDFVCSAFTDAELEREIFQIIGNRYNFIISFSPTGGVWGSETFSEMYGVQLIDWLDEGESIMERADTGANAKAKILIYLIENKLVEVK